MTADDDRDLREAALAGDSEQVKRLLDRGARVADDLLSSVRLRVDSLKENAESGMVRPEAARAWEQFLSFLITARLKQDFPVIVEQLASAVPTDRLAAIESVASAAIRGIKIDAALLSLCGILDAGDQEIKTAVIAGIAAGAQNGTDITPMLPSLARLFHEPALNLRHDTAIALGYAAASGFDVSSTVPDLIALLTAPEPEARTMAAWALYRIGKHVGDISKAVPALQTACADDDPDVREMAHDALRIAPLEREG